MSNLFDYLTWRGDLSFGNAPLNPVDALIFSMLSYLDLTDAVPSSPAAEPIRLSEAATRYFSLPRVAASTGKGNHEKLLKALAGSERFGSLRLTGGTRETDAKSGMQFGALSILLPGQQLFVAFEGTDSTLIGWQEDFRMSYECPVPAQLRAARYLSETAGAFPLRKLLLGGHSKGGNLAMYAAVYAEPGVKERIKAVYNNDGPGFCDGTLSTAEYAEMRSRIRTYMPESSIVAVLLEHDDKHKLVQSSHIGIAQHDGYSWKVSGPDFLFAEKRSVMGERTEAVLDRFISTLSPERKKQFSKALFEILAASEQETITGIVGNKRQSMKNITKAYADMTAEMRQMLAETVKILKKSDKAAKADKQ